MTRPTYPTEAMLRAGLEVRYLRSPRSRRVKETNPHGFESWMVTGLKMDAPGMAEEFLAMEAAAPKKAARQEGT